MTTTPDYTKKIEELRSRVENHVTTMPSTNSGWFRGKSSILTFTANSPIFYILPPLVSLFLLIVFKPSFLTPEITDKDGNTSKKFSYKRLFITFAVISIVLDIAVFAYFKKTAPV